MGVLVERVDDEDRPRRSSRRPPGWRSGRPRRPGPTEAASTLSPTFSRRSRPVVAVATRRQRWRVPRLKVAKAIMSAFLPSCAIRASRGRYLVARSGAALGSPVAVASGVIVSPTAVSRSRSPRLPAANHASRRGTGHLLAGRRLWGTLGADAHRPHALRRRSRHRPEAARRRRHRLLHRAQRPRSGRDPARRAGGARPHPRGPAWSSAARSRSTSPTRRPSSGAARWRPSRRGSASWAARGAGQRPAEPAPAAQPRGGLGGAGPGSDRGDPGHLRPASGDRGGEDPGGDGPIGASPPPPRRRVDPPGAAARRRGPSRRPGRDPDRGGPAADPAADRQAAPPARAAGAPAAHPPSGAERRAARRPAPWSATPTPASRPCSTG